MSPQRLVQDWQSEARGFCACLILFVLLLRVAVPVGWMPVQSANGVTFTLCTGSGHQEIVVQPGGQKAPDKQQTGGGQLCAFAAAAAPWIDGLPAQINAPALLTFALVELPALAGETRISKPWQTPPSQAP